MMMILDGLSLLVVCADLSDLFKSKGKWKHLFCATDECRRRDVNVTVLSQYVIMLEIKVQPALD